MDRLEAMTILLAAVDTGNLSAAQPPLGNWARDTAQSQRAARAAGQLSASITHEFKQPIGAARNQHHCGAAFPG